MRLTLRTMLAYLDEMLEPADAEDIRQKIEESDFATGVVNRVRDVTRRMRLEAPRLRGRSMGIDPNTVAQYLDNTLAAERVPEFEKLCLESDMYLAEVAAAHQILTLVLGEPAEIDPALRERVYALIRADLHAPARQTEDEYTVAPREENPSPQIVDRPKVEVPTYLRESGGSSLGLWQIGAIAALVLLTAATVWMAVGSNDRQPQVAVREAPADAIREHAPGDGEKRAVELAPRGAASDSSTKTERESSNESGTGTDTNRADENAQAPPEPGPADLPLTPLVPSGEGPLAPRDFAASDAAAEEPLPEAPLPSDATPSEAPPMPDAALPPDAPPPPPNGASPPIDVIGGESGDAEARSTEPPPDALAGTSPPPTIVPEGAVEGTPDVAERLDASRQALGRVVSAKQVLVRGTPGGDWQRLAPQDVLFPGDVLASLPAFRNSVALGVGLTADLLGPARVELTMAGDLPTLNLHYGRMVLMNVGKAGARLRLLAGDTDGTLVFVDAESSAAIELVAKHEAGLDPLSAPRTWEMNLFAVSGESAWEPTVGTPVTITAPARRTFVAGQILEGAAADVPTWVVSERLKPIEQKAADALDEALTGDRPLVLRLKELVDGRKEEVRALAVRGLAELEEFAPIVATLGDPRQRAYWFEQFEALQSAVSRSPQTAARIQQTLAEAKGKEHGGDLFRMLAGYTSQDLSEGGGARLIRGLDDDDLLCRVLAFCNLQQVTGRTLSYRPDDPPAKRRPDVQRWRQLYEDGQLKPARAAAPASDS